MKARGRLLVAIGLVLLAGAAVLVARPWRTSPEAWRVKVRVVDLDGRPIAGAQVRARYRAEGSGWASVGADGVALLGDVPLREGEADAPDAVAAALDARAKFFGRRGRESEAARDAQGRTEVTFRLERHGVLRVIVAPTRFTTARAWVDPDPVLRRVEALDGIAIARSGGEAAWRVYPGLDAVVVHLEGENGVAWRRVVLEPPSPGFLREVTLVPEAAQAISGVVERPEGSTAPATGRMEVSEIDAQGNRTPLPDVEVAADGGFTVPYAAPGRYALRARLDFYDVPAEGTASAGGFVTMSGARARAVGRFRLTGLDEGRRASLRVTGRREDDGSPTPLVHRFAEDRLLVVLDRLEGPTHVEVVAPGDDAKPPLGGAVDLRDAAEADVEMRPVPEGRVVVRLLDAPETGAVVQIGDRQKTVLPGLGSEATFDHVEAGDVVGEVSWRGRAAASTLAGRLEEGGTLRLEARAVPGGRLVLEGGGDAVGKDARDRVVRAKERAIPFRREGLEPLWVTAEPLLPGSYDGTVEPDGVPVRFEVRAGEETRVPFAVAAADAEAASRRKGP